VLDRVAKPCIIIFKNTQVFQRYISDMQYINMGENAMLNVYLMEVETNIRVREGMHCKVLT
jgi:hypothetical protein